MKGHWISYSADELAFCEARQTMLRRQLHAAFVEAFGRNDVSVENFKAMCTRKGWKTGRTGCFPKGIEPHNKGKPHPASGRSAQTQFKKGAVPPNRRSLGDERVGKDGYIEISVPITNPYTGHSRRFMPKHRYLWEQVNGPLPKGMALKFLDGDRANCDPSNMELIPRALLPRLNGGRHKKRMSYDAAPAELKPTLMAVAKLEQAISEKVSV